MSHGNERLIAEWSDTPFTSHRRRHVTVHHRLILTHYPGVGVDLRHEVRAPDYTAVGDDWLEAEVWEVRDHGIRTVASDDRWWST